MFGGKRHDKLQTNLRLAINRFKLMEKKKSEQARKARADIAEYLKAGKVERARIRVEHIIREDYMVEAMEILEMYCDLLVARFGLIKSSKEIDPGLEEQIATLIWAQPRLQSEVQELKVISDQFGALYGKEFAQKCHNNELDNVDERVMHRLSVHAPSPKLVEDYLVSIADYYKVPYVPDPSFEEAAVMASENLIDLDGAGGPRRPHGGPGFGGGGGGGGGGLDPLKPSPYPPGQFQAAGSGHASAPALPSVPPVGNVYPPPAGAAPYPTGPVDTKVPPPASYNNAPPFVQPQVPSYNEAMNVPPPQAGASNRMENSLGLPELPAVPTDTLPANSVGGASAGGEDVDFDDLTKRFEELKKRK